MRCMEMYDERKAKRRMKKEKKKKNIFAHTRSKIQRQGWGRDAPTNTLPGFDSFHDCIDKQTCTKKERK